MSALFIIGVLLIVLFGFSVSAYLTYYKFSIQNFIGKLVVFVLLGVIFSTVTFTISLTLIWPPVM
ncbi:hypothetical protein [Phosphitispora fastidiosa]|uniref:hypothetical protein n=1 Tax=Phosphitispora fastidiosa TaxID=2837202 RepID=UPI001E36E933|nr:hypothetical protein [Phosphitispora fastidiosa]MBU7007563.1 putative neutral ceramidase superfamily lipid hydrolase [Phosphitispora fastidiosa]